MNIGTEEERADLVIQLAALTVEVVVTDVKNPALEDHIKIGWCVTSVNGEDIVPYEYDEGMNVLKGAIAGDLTCRCSRDSMCVRRPSTQSQLHIPERP